MKKLFISLLLILSFNLGYTQIKTVVVTINVKGPFDYDSLTNVLSMKVSSAFNDGYMSKSQATTVDSLSKAFVPSSLIKDGYMSKAQVKKLNDADTKVNNLTTKVNNDLITTNTKITSLTTQTALIPTQGGAIKNLETRIIVHENKIDSLQAKLDAVLAELDAQKLKIKLLIEALLLLK